MDSEKPTDSKRDDSDDNVNEPTEVPTTENQDQPESEAPAVAAETEPASEPETDQVDQVESSSEPVVTEPTADESTAAEELPVDDATTPAVSDEAVNEDQGSSEAFNQANPVPDAVTPPVVGGEPSPGEAPTGVVVAGATAGAVAGMASVSQPGRRSRKRLFVGLAVILLVVLLTGGFVFGYYIPNRPGNVWKSALTNSGKAYDMLTQYATKDRQDKGVKVDGSFGLTGKLQLSGNFHGQTANKSGQVTGDFTTKQGKTNFEFRSLTAPNSSLPDMYLKIDNIGSIAPLLGFSGALPSQLTKAINNQWFSVDHSLFNEASGGSSSAVPQVTRADVKQLLDTVGTVSKQYVFTDDQSKAVLVMKQIVGAEKKDGRNTYHYKVGINQAHYKAYVKALCDAVKDDKLVKQLSSSKPADCEKAAADIKQSDADQTFDVWVDRRTKLPHVIRLTDDKNKATYVELSQDYQGGAEMPFGFKVHDQESDTTTDFNLTATANTKTDVFTAKLTFSVAGKTSDDNQQGTMSLKLTPSNDSSFKVQKPAKSEPIMSLIFLLAFSGAMQQQGGGAATTDFGSSSAMPLANPLPACWPTGGNLLALLGGSSQPAGCSPRSTPATPPEHVPAVSASKQ